MSFWERAPPMGPCEDPSSHSVNQVQGGNVPRRQRARRPRSRLCLLKGCGHTFRPQHPMTRYCSESCCLQARRWREWKARHRYRQTDGGKRKRQAQCRRYRLRRKKPRTSTVDGARVIARKKFSGVPATGPAVTRSLSAVGARRCGDSVPMRVAGLWNGSGIGRGTGESASRPGDETPRDIVLAYCVLRHKLHRLSLPTTEEGGARPAGTGALRSLFFSFSWGRNRGAGVPSTRTSLRKTEAGPS